MKQDRNGVRNAQDLERKYDLKSIVGLKKAVQLQEKGLNKTNTELENFVNSTTSTIDNLQEQIDGNITTYYYSGVPTLSNLPVSEWDESKYNVHLGDLYYDKDTGYAYRFYLDSATNQYGWIRLSDVDVVEALAIANAASDTADSKRRVFTDTPTPPYDNGDLWINNEEIYICQVTKDSTQQYSSDDFIIATKYTDNTLANQVDERLTVVSGRVTTVEKGVDELSAQMEENRYYLDENGNKVLISEQINRINANVNGLTNSMTTVGGNNIFRNTGLWFTTTAQNANFENRIKLRTDFELYSKEEASQFINEIGRIGSYEYTYEGSDYTIGTKTFISSVIPLSSTQNIYLFSPTNWLTYKNRDLTYDGIDYNFFSSEPPGMYHTPPYELYGIDENNKIIMKIQPFYVNFEGGYSQLSFKNISLDSAYGNFSEELEKAVKGIIIVFKVTLSTYKFNPDDVNNPIKNDINIENYIKKYFLDYYNDPNNEENKNYIQQHINDYIPDQTSDFIKNETKKVDIIYQSIKKVSYGNFEYWEGNASRNSNENASNGNSMLLQNGEFSQEQMVNNGRYCISFKYQKLNPLAQASVIINDIEYPLDSEILTEFYTGKVDNETKVFLTQPLVVNAGYIRITFKCDINNAVEVYDLMCNKGISKSVYSQNENETTTDTVNISKGITITSTNMETIFKANADGVRLHTLSGQIKTRFTDKGMTTKEAIVEDEAQIVGTLWQEVGDQTWITRM